MVKWVTGKDGPADRKVTPGLRHFPGPCLVLLKATGRALAPARQNSAQTRAAHYRQQAAELRGMAVNHIDEGVRRELLDLAVKYDALANSVSKTK